MACATLKRHLDWEPALGVRPTKRRRCNPLCSGADKSSPKQSYRGPRPPTSAPELFSNSSPSPFANVVCPKITPETMAANLREEIRRLHKRKQIQYTNSTTERMQDTSSEGSNSGSEQGPESPARSDKALFTFKQVGMICERMLRERETLLREEYDQVLTSKLAEQYDAFVKFTYDQIQKRYEAAPSYLS